MEPSMVDVDEAVCRLNELIDRVLHGAEVIITREDQPIVMLVSFGNAHIPGSVRAPVTARDGFDESLEDFRDYV